MRCSPARPVRLRRESALGRPKPAKADRASLGSLANRSRERGPQAGFTLIELIASVVLVGMVGVAILRGVLAATQGFLIVRQNAALAQDARPALTRVVGELRGAQAVRLADPNFPPDGHRTQRDLL